MDKDFESVVMGKYADLCMRWRLARVADRVQADDFDFQLTSLESVIKAFGLPAPGVLAEGEIPQPRSMVPHADGLILED